MMLRAEPASNHSIWSSFMVWLHWKSTVEPSALCSTQSTGRSSARSARPVIEIVSPSPITDSEDYKAALNYSVQIAPLNTVRDFLKLGE